VRYERIKFLVVGIENSLSIYAWAPRPYSKFMAFKVICLMDDSFIILIIDDSEFWPIDTFTIDCGFDN
jgi:hypothetical protein